MNRAWLVSVYVSRRAPPDPTESGAGGRGTASVQKCPDRPRDGRGDPGAIRLAAGTDTGPTFLSGTGERGVGVRGRGRRGGVRASEGRAMRFLRTLFLAVLAAFLALPASRTVTAQTTGRPSGERRWTASGGPAPGRLRFEDPSLRAASRRSRTLCDRRLRSLPNPEGPAGGVRRSPLRSPGLLAPASRRTSNVASETRWADRPESTLVVAASAAVEGRRQR